MSGSVVRRAWADINLQALQHNFALARAQNTACHIVAVIKANAYGHGVMAIADALLPLLGPQDCFGVATLDEALSVHSRHKSRAVLLLEGVNSAEEQEAAINAGCQCVIHAPWQLTLLQDYLRAHPDTPAKSLTIWLKLDTGMHRLGMNSAEFVAVHQQLAALPAVGRTVIMSHLACADDLLSPVTQRQINLLHKFLAAAGLQAGESCELSVAASAGILAWPQTHFQWFRPGIMLYGGSPFLKENGDERGLQPVMTLRSRLIAIKDVPAGDAIGYGATFVCTENKRIGVVSVGYGDGYPRHAPNGTPVLVRCASSILGKPRTTRLLGRVSMDMITIDLSDIKEAAIGDEVILWGEGLSADEIARQCGSSSYELFCRVTARVQFVYRQGAATVKDQQLVRSTGE